MLLGEIAAGVKTLSSEDALAFTEATRDREQTLKGPKSYENTKRGFLPQ